jgi:hypothetical protein
MVHAGFFPGAACYELVELPCYKAAPLQRERANPYAGTKTAFDDENSLPDEALGL